MEQKRWWERERRVWRRSPLSSSAAAQGGRRPPRVAAGVAHRACGGVDRAPTDRQRHSGARDGEARSPGDLSPRPDRTSHPADQRYRHRRPPAPRPHRALRPGGNADQMGWQHPGLPDRRARGATARTGCWRQGQLGADRQIPSTAERQAVSIPQYRARCRGHWCRADDSVRAARIRGSGRGQPHRRIQGANRGCEPQTGSRQVRAGRDARIGCADDRGPASACRRPAQRGAIRLSAEPDCAGRAAHGGRHPVQRGIRKLRRQWADDGRVVERRGQRPCRAQWYIKLHRQPQSGAGRHRPVGPARAARRDLRRPDPA